MTRLMILLAAIGGGLAGTSGAGSQTHPDPARAQRPAVVVQASCASPARSLATARAAAPARADVLLACGAADAQAVVLRAVASGHDAVLGTGPDVRAAMALAQADHPEVAFAPLR